MNTYSFGHLFLALVLSSSLLPAAEPKEMPLWLNGAPGSEGKTSKEVVEAFANGICVR